MATAAELNQFKRLIGDYGKDKVDESSIDEFLDDATAELTTELPIPTLDFDSLAPAYKREIIIYAAIQWWWNHAAKLVDHHSQSVGQSSHQASEKWDRAMQMIQRLEEQYGDIQTLGQRFQMGNLSRFSKLTLRRQGGQSEEDFFAT